jgi:hypothetical protein
VILVDTSAWIGHLGERDPQLIEYLLDNPDRTIPTGVRESGAHELGGASRGVRMRWSLSARCPGSLLSVGQSRERCLTRPRRCRRNAESMRGAHSKCLGPQTSRSQGKSNCQNARATGQRNGQTQSTEALRHREPTPQQGLNLPSHRTGCGSQTPSAHLRPRAPHRTSAAL